MFYGISGFRNPFPSKEDQEVAQQRFNNFAEDFERQWLADYVILGHLIRLI